MNIKSKRYIYLLLLLLSLGLVGFSIFNKIDVNKTVNVGDAIDNLNGVAVYHNGPTSNVLGRNTVDGYNLGLKYQCVEFVKRYYYHHLHHKMPDSWGHAKSFFNKIIGKLLPVYFGVCKQMCIKITRSTAKLS